jgi:hypothetical protein
LQKRNGGATFTRTPPIKPLNLIGVLGVTGLRSTSGTGISMISVEFNWGTDMLQARQLLNESLVSVRGQLPASAQVTIENLSVSLSMIEGFTLSGDENLLVNETSASHLNDRVCNGAWPLAFGGWIWFGSRVATSNRHCRDLWPRAFDTPDFVALALCNLCIAHAQKRVVA